MISVTECSSNTILCITVHYGGKFTLPGHKTGKQETTLFMERISNIEKTGPQIALLVWAEQSYKKITMKIIVLCEQTREANKRIKIYFFWIICLVLVILCLIFMFRVRGN